MADLIVSPLGIGLSVCREMVTQRFQGGLIG